LAAVKCPMSRFTPKYFEYDIAVAKLSGFANSSGSVRFEWPWKPTITWCLSANGATRFDTLTCVVDDIALTPRAFAIPNA
jgi:hypothetical protein